MKNLLKLIVVLVSLVLFSFNRSYAGGGSSTDGYTPYLVIDGNTPLPHPALPPGDVAMCIDKDHDKFGVIGYFTVPGGMDLADFIQALKNEGWTPLAECTYEGLDCDDADPVVFKKMIIYADKDGDGYRDGAPIEVCWNYTPWPVPGYIKGSDSKGVDEKNDFIDCDLVPGSHIAELVYKDDGDFWVNGKGEWICIKADLIPAGYISHTQVLGRPDCAPLDPATWREVELLYDGDGDNHVVAGTPITKMCIGNTLPPKYILAANRLGVTDCDDADPTVWRNICIFSHYINAHQWVNTTICWGGSEHPLDCRTYQPGIEYTVFPNPVTNVLKITPSINWNDRVEIKLIDQYSRVVRSMLVPNGMKGQTFTINTTDLKPGLYQLTIRRGEMVESKTIAVKL